MLQPPVAQSAPLYPKAHVGLNVGLGVGAGVGDAVGASVIFAYSVIPQTGYQSLRWIEIERTQLVENEHLSSLGLLVECSNETHDGSAVQ